MSASKNAITRSKFKTPLSNSRFPPALPQNEYFLGYKQARRRDDDIAIVNAGMRVAFRPDSIAVEQLRLAFGGMAPTTVMAPATMEVSPAEARGNYSYIKRGKGDSKEYEIGNN